MELLVSVRSADEAETAMRGGAGLIDVKEPARGPLGAADVEVIEAVIHRVAGRLPVSAALGEMPLNPRLPLIPAGLRFVKWGLAGWRGADWERGLTWARQVVGESLVVAAYADAELASSPPLDDLLAWACRERAAAFLIDTFDKFSRRSLLDWLSPARVARLCARCRIAGVPVALAGSLGPDEIGRLRAAQPDWFAVRGAVCGRGQRWRTIAEDRVRCLAKLVRGAQESV